MKIHIAMSTITRHSTSDTNLREAPLFASCDACRQIAFVDVDRIEGSDGYDADREEGKRLELSVRHVRLYRKDRTCIGEESDVPVSNPALSHWPQPANMITKSFW